MDRREVVKSGFTLISISLAGCAQTPGEQQQATCRTVSETQSQTIYDYLEEWTAGESNTWEVDLKRGDQIFIKSVQVEGARPDLEIKNSDGELIIDTGPQANIERAFTAPESGTYYITLTNEAILTSGRWDVEIQVTKITEEEVCS